MALEFEKMLDSTGWLLLQELQLNARLSFSELGQRVGLSAPAVADRIHRMEEAGIITGYRAEVNTSKLGLPVKAIIRLGSVAGQSCTTVALRVSEIPEVIECYRVTGSDSVIIKVVATSVTHLERIIDQLSLYGLPTTSIVLSKPIQKQTITREMVERGETEESMLSQNEAFRF
ncbi:MAG TPA: Lrp/AsnC family transcriptional regulator [Ktedonobacteraceae bacterium]|nr:Lrp/AsnC family transcriptional regulator [Ktedonobacteraceae bacterium]